MLTVPRLSSRIRVALYGDPNGVADIEALELQRNSIEVHQTKKQTSSGEFTWRNCSHRFRAKQSKAQDAKLAFDNFTASVATHASHDGATNMLVNVAGDVYGALLADGTADKGVARANLEATFGSVKDRDWRTVLEAFEALVRLDTMKRESASLNAIVHNSEEWTDPDYIPSDPRPCPVSKSAESDSSRAEATAEWLVAKCDSLSKYNALSTFDVALGVVTAARNSGGDDAVFQSALFELLGVTDEALAVMSELCERRASLAKLDTADVRAISVGSSTTDHLTAEHTVRSSRRPGSVTITSATESRSRRQSKKKRHKEHSRAAKAHQQVGNAPTSEAADVLVALGFDPSCIEQEHSLGLPTKLRPHSKPSHTEQLLQGQDRVYNEQRSFLPGSERFYGDGYEEIAIEPPVRLDPPKPSELVALDSALPGWARCCFPESLKQLNRVQSAVFGTVFGTQKNTLVCAPTGAGKTYVALLSVLEIIARHTGTLLNDFDEDKFKQAAELLSSHKIVYIAPLKALAQEVVQKFSERLRPLGLNVRELTGDVQLSKREAEAAHVLVATPEKWDVVTRKQGTEGSLATLCRLLIIDEIHLLAEERGAVLECIVARTRQLVESSQFGVRLLGLSATLPNYSDVAEFLACPDDAVFFFGPEFRPVPLKQTFIGVTEQKRLKAAVKLDELAYRSALDAVDRGHQVMIFVHSRRDTSKTAAYLRDRAGREGRAGAFDADDPSAIKRFTQALDKARHGDLREFAPAGITVHHAGMCRSDRALAENMFARGAVKVLCCTATLAWGVNLPAHAVICKGTEIYTEGKWTDMSMLDVLQIFGRAGRPQFDDFGEATLLTSHKALPDYLRKLVRAAPIESCLVPRLADAINAEVASGTVSSIRDAVSWLSHTFLSVRLRKNPLAYGISIEAARADPMLMAQREKLCRQAAEKLDDARMARYDKRSGAISGTDVGRIGSHYYLRHESVREFGERLQEHATDAAIVAVVCSAYEFEQLQPRADEIPELDRLRLSSACPLHARAGMRMPTDRDNLSFMPPELAKIADDAAGKAACLLQAHVSRAPISSFTLASDAAYVAKNAARVCRALYEVALRAKYASLAERLLRLAKAVERRVWWFQTPLRQLADLEPTATARHRNFPEDALRNLESKNISLDRLLVDCSNRADVGALVRNHKAGSYFVTVARLIPAVDLSVEVVPITGSVIRFTVVLEPNYQWNGRVHGTAPEPFVVWVEDSVTERLHYYETVNLMPPKKSPSQGNLRRSAQSTTTTFTISMQDPLPPQFFVRAFSDRWFGLSSLFEISTNRLKLPATHTINTDLLPLHPLPTSALGNSNFESLYNFSHFNPVQTQLFFCLFHTDNNVLLGAPTGSGKTVVAELAVMRMLAARTYDERKQHVRAKAVYVAPLKALASERLRDWQRKFHDKLGMNVHVLTGDATPDARALHEADILITTPEKWDGVTRMWKSREYVRHVSLLIIDEIHLLGEDRGPVIESIVSRIRFSGHNVRLVGLSTAISNAQDLAEWLGVDQSGLFNFRPVKTSAVRPVPCVPHIAGFPGKHYCPRMATMNKPCYAAILEHARAAPALVFVASRRQTRLTALDLISVAAGDDSVEGGAAALWVDALAISEVEEAASECHDVALKQCLVFGVGIHHAGLPERDRDTVERLFESKKIRVLISTSTLAWGVNLPARLVVIKGTEYYDARLKKYVDYPVTDILQMMGRAGRPQFDDSAVAVLLVHAPKKEFLKRMLFSPFPIESHLIERVHNMLMAEVCATRSISDKEDAVNYMRCTFFYQRLRQNPTYYKLEDAHQDEAVLTFLRDLIDVTFDDLAAAGAIQLDEDRFSVAPATLGRIASYYYLDYRTTRDASESLAHIEDDVLSPFPPTETFRDAGADDDGRVAAESAAIGLLCAAREFDELPVRHNEDVLNEELADALGLSPELAFDDPHVKAQLLIHARLRGATLPIADYVTDTRSVLENCSRVLAALIDVAADAGALRSTLALCRLSQALGTSCSFQRDELCQLPGVDIDGAQRLRATLQLVREQGVREALSSPRFKEALRREQSGSTNNNSSDDIINMLRTDLSMTASLADPDTGEVVGQSMECDTVYAIRISLALRQSRRKSLQNSSAALGRWLVLAESEDLLALKRIAIPSNGRVLDVSLMFTARETLGRTSLILHALADDVRGLDSRLEIPVEVVPKTLTDAGSAGDELVSSSP